MKAMQFVTKWKSKDGTYKTEELVWENGNISWQERLPIPFGDITQESPIPADAQGEVCEDLQVGNDRCFLSNLYVCNGEKFLALLGNGWESIGYPYNEEIGYPLIGGETCKKMIKASRDGYIRDWSKVFSGNMNDLYLKPQGE